MFNVPTDYEDVMSGARNIWYKGTITTVMGAVYTFDASNIVSGTGSINRRISDGTSFEIGSVTAAEFTVSLFWTGVSRYELYDAVVNVSCCIGKHASSYILDDWAGASAYTWSGLAAYMWQQLQSVIEIPMGEFYVNEVTQDASTIAITAYDGLLKFDKEYVQETTSMTPYRLLRSWCDTCGVLLATSLDEISAMPNGTESVVCDLESVMDITTYRDALSYLCVVLCAVAVMGRDGRLYILNYGTTSEKTFDASQRYSSKLSDYVCYYTRLRHAYGETVSDYIDTSYTGADDGLTLDIGVNPFMQISSVNRRDAMCQAILTKLASVHYAPYEVSLPSRPELDIMDVIGFTGGKTGAYDFGAITDITYDFDSPMTLKCSGQDPKMQSAEDRYDKIVHSVATLAKTNESFSNLFTNAFGLYRSEIPDPVVAGSYTYAMHDEQEFDNSTFAMIANSEGLYMLSRESASDSWTITSASVKNGNALVNVLTAVGINADWIKSGTLKLGGENNRRGVLEIYDADGDLSGRWQNGGLYSYASSGSGAYLRVDGGNAWFYREDGTSYITVQPMGIFSYYKGNPSFSLTDSWITTTSGDNYYGPSLSGYGFLNIYRSPSAANTYISMTSGDHVNIRSETANVNIIAGEHISMRGGGDILLSSTDNAYINISATGSISLSAGSSGYIFAQRIYGATTSSAANVYVASGGAMYRSTSSSKRYKTDITENLGELDPNVLYDLKVVKFKFKDGYVSEDDERYGKDVIGFIAEDVDELYPIAVRHEDGHAEMWESNYMIPAMMKLIQDQKAEIDELKARLDALESAFKSQIQ